MNNLNWDKDGEWLIACSECCNNWHWNCYYIRLTESTDEEIVKFINKHEWHCFRISNLDEILDILYEDDEENEEEIKRLTKIKEQENEME